jgi:hypothetical protein
MKGFPMTTAQFSEPMFEARVHFNWGYHDAVAAHARQAVNYGFGPTLTITTPADVLRQHYDRAYAMGWTYGYNAAVRGEAASTSDEAWTEAVNFEDIDPRQA